MFGARTIRPAMKVLPKTPELLEVARRVTWFEEPERPLQFLAYVMVFGTPEDLRALRGTVGKDDYCEVLQHAPPGVFDPRSWGYWNLVCGRQPVPPHALARRGTGCRPFRGGKFPH